MATINRFDQVTLTRFTGLAAAKVTANHFQYVDCYGEKHPQDGAAIGAIYPTRAAMNADLIRFARERGYLPPVPTEAEAVRERIEALENAIEATHFFLHGHACLQLCAGHDRGEELRELIEAVRTKAVLAP